MLKPGRKKKLINVLSMLKENEPQTAILYSKNPFISFVWVNTSSHGETTAKKNYYSI